MKTIQQAQDKILKNPINNIPNKSIVKNKNHFSLKNWPYYLGLSVQTFGNNN